MRNLFAGYYPPTESELKTLWSKATVVLDTNVLLNLYRLPVAARDDFLGVLEIFKSRIWLPHQVALEFQRRRLTVIATERKTTEDAFSYASGLIDEIRKRIDKLQLDKRALDVKPADIIKELDEAHQSLIKPLKAAHEQQLDISSIDPIRDRIDKIIDNKIGEAPANQQDLDSLLKDADQRYASSIPPGYMDQDKDKNPNEASFIFSQIKYQRKFGDLILWLQTINHAKNQNLKHLILVTADRKEDWWWREQGKTIGPQPELVREIQSKAGLELFWMYSSDQFVEHAKQYAKAQISSESISEIKNVSQAPNPERLTVSHSGMHHFSLASAPSVGSVKYRPEISDFRLIEAEVLQWLRRERGDAIPNEHGFPDFILDTSTGLHGYEVKFLRHFDRMLVTPNIVNAMLRGYMELNEGRLSEFTLVLVIPDGALHDIQSENSLHQLRYRFGRLLGKYPISEIVIGVLGENGFNALLTQRDRFPEE
jgi:hypothetical protein